MGIVNYNLNLLEETPIMKMSIKVQLEEMAKEMNAQERERKERGISQTKLNELLEISVRGNSQYGYKDSNYKEHNYRSN